MAHAYGTRIDDVLGDATSIEDLGDGLSTREVDYLVAKEWARSVDDILWRRTKLGIHGGETLRDAVEAYLRKTGVIGG